MAGVAAQTCLASTSSLLVERHSLSASSTAFPLRQNCDSISVLPSITNSTSSVARVAVVSSRQAAAGHYRRGDLVVRRAKFQGFKQPPANADSPLGEVEGAVNGAVVAAEQGSEAAADGRESDARDDDVLPPNLDVAVRHAAHSTAQFCNGGGTRAVVELLVPELEGLSEEGAQQLVWNSSRLFLDSLKGELNYENVRAVFPDAGVAALLRYQWQDAAFAISSLNDRQPVDPNDDVVVLLVPDYQLLSVVERIAGTLKDEDGLTRPLIMWNPRLFSGDVGIGLNVRRLREFFLASFTTVYHLRPNDVGAIFRRYPNPWQLFLDDPNEPGRYILMRQQGSKPTLDDVEEMYMVASGGGDISEEPSMFEQAASVVSSFARFMNSLTK